MDDPASKAKPVKKPSDPDTIILDDDSPKNVPFWISVENVPVKKDRQVSTVTGKEKYVSKKKMRAKKATADAESSLNFTGSPFNVKVQRFLNMGIHPMFYEGRPKVPITKTGSLLPPVEHNQDSCYVWDCGWKAKDFYKDQVLTTGQQRAKDERIRRESLIAPGCYNLPALIDTKGVTFLSGRRFLSDDNTSSIKGLDVTRELYKRMWCIPGPGTYTTDCGRKCDHHEGKTLFQSSLGHLHQESAGSGLYPGLYDKKDNISDRSQQKAGQHGLYQMFSRYKWDRMYYNIPISEAQRAYTVGPGSYNPQDKQKTDFSRTTEEQKMNLRNWSTKSAHSQIYLINKNPGPGTYEMKPFLLVSNEDSRIKESSKAKAKGISMKAEARGKRWADRFGFLSTTKRRDKLTYNCWKFSNNAVGPGRYDIHKFYNKMKHEGQDKGHESVFLSKLGQRGDCGDGHGSKESMRQIKAYERKKLQLDSLLSVKSKTKDVTVTN